MEPIRAKARRVPMGGILCGLMIIFALKGKVLGRECIDFEG